jgi:hypothetical protein
MTRFGYAFGIAAALLGLAGIVEPAKAATIVYTLTGDSPDIGGPFDLSFTSEGFLVLPVGDEELTISTATTCFLVGGPCSADPAIFSLFGDTTQFYVSVVNLAADSGLSPSFGTADFGAVGTYQSLNNPVTMTVSAAAAPEPSTWAMLLVGFSGLGFAGYRKAGAIRAARANPT